MDSEAIKSGRESEVVEGGKRDWEGCVRGAGMLENDRARMHSCYASNRFPKPMRMLRTQKLRVAQRAVYVTCVFEKSKKFPVLPPDMKLS